jgi:hypothetical protein
MTDTPRAFSREISRSLCDRVGTVCSNRACRAPTLETAQGASTAVEGRAIAIHSCSPDGPRYDAAQTEDERISIHNAVWLCGVCAALVEADEVKFPAPVLRAWRADAELAAFERLGNAAASVRAPSDGAPLSDSARELMRSIATLYVNAGFPPAGQWSFTPGNSSDRRYAELRALGFVAFGTLDRAALRLGQRGVDWIMRNREKEALKT